MRLQFHLPLLVLLLLLATKAYPAEVIAVDPVRILPSLVEQSQSSGQRLHLERFQESLERFCQEELRRSGRFKVVARRDLQKILNDLKLSNSGLSGPNGAQVGNFSANSRLLIVSINKFGISKVERKFEELGKIVSRIEMPYNVSASVYETNSAETKYSFAKEGTHEKAITVPISFASQDQKLDSEVTSLSRILAKAIARDLTTNAFPPKVVSIRGSLVAINRGSLHDVKIGDKYTVFGNGEELIDPDSGEKLGSEQVPIGSIQVTSVNQKFSHAKTLENFGIEKGAACKKQMNPADSISGPKGSIGDSGTSGPGTSGIAVAVKAAGNHSKSKNVLLVIENQNSETDISSLAGLATSQLSSKGYHVTVAKDVIFNLEAKVTPKPDYTNVQLMEFSDCSFALILGKVTLSTTKQTINRQDLDLFQEIVSTTISLPYRLLSSNGNGVFSGVERQIYKDSGNDPILSNTGSIFHEKLSSMVSSTGQKTGEFLSSSNNSVEVQIPKESKFSIKVNPFVMPFPEVTFADGQASVKNTDTTFIPRAINIAIDGVLSGAAFNDDLNSHEVVASSGLKHIEISAPGYQKFERHIKVRDGITFTISIPPTPEFRRELRDYAEKIEEMKLRSKITQAAIDKLIAESKFMENSKVVIDGAPPAKEIVIPGVVIPR
ncbi:MAG: hypothetical protein HOI70_06595 [Opitutae bacterium]|jgi:hypothetical protein|nr:hypothetical protein [Opitutae bacterium]